MKEIADQHLILKFIDEVENFVMDSWVNFADANKKRKLMPYLTKKDMLAVKGFYNFLMAQLEEARTMQQEGE